MNNCIIFTIIVALIIIFDGESKMEKIINYNLSKIIEDEHIEILKKAGIYTDFMEMINGKNSLIAVCSSDVRYLFYKSKIVCIKKNDNIVYKVPGNADTLLVLYACLGETKLFFEQIENYMQPIIDENPDVDIFFGGSNAATSFSIWIEKNK